MSSEARERYLLGWAGSRIPQPNLTSVSPIQVVTDQEFKLQGATDVINLINTLVTGMICLFAAVMVVNAYAAEHLEIHARQIDANLAAWEKRHDR